MQAVHWLIGKQTFKGPLRRKLNILQKSIHVNFSYCLLFLQHLQCKVAPYFFMVHKITDDCIAIGSKILLKWKSLTR